MCKKIASDYTNSSTEECHHGEVSKLSDNDPHKAEYIIDKEQHIGTLTSTQIFSGINYFIAYGKNVIRNSATFNSSLF